jgi:cytoskeleton-associated protein 5
MFAHTDKTVRLEAVHLSQQLYRNIGEAIDPWLSDLKPVQIKELHESFEVMDKEGNGKGSFKPERLTRSQQQGQVVGEVFDTREGILFTCVIVSLVMNGIAAVEELDPRNFAEEVDIVGDIPSGFHAALSSSKWKDRKEALDEVAGLLMRAVRIKDSPELSSLCKDLAGRMSDANINCVIVAANCIEALAKGLSSNFAKYKDTVMRPMLERLKERKQSVSDAIGNALDALFYTVSHTGME